MPLVDIRHYGVIIIKIISFFKEENQAKFFFDKTQWDRFQKHEGQSLAVDWFD